MRPTDIVIQVQEGRCHLGVTGMDVFAEHAVETDVAMVVSPDLGYGGCRLAVAVPESWIDVSHIMDLVDLTTEFKTAGRTFRVSTKYPALVRQYFRKFGIYYYQLIDSEGALELHPSLGIADIIVDLTSSGTTLKDNRLREIEGGTVLESAACLIGHAPSLATLAAEGENGPLAHLLDAIDGVRGAEGWLHLEVVGSQSAPGPETAALVADSSPRARGLAHRPRRSLGRPGQPRLASDRLVVGPQADRLPASPLPPGRQPRRRAAAADRLRPRWPLHLRQIAPAVDSGLPSQVPRWVRIEDRCGGGAR